MPFGIITGASVLSLRLRPKSCNSNPSRGQPFVIAVLQFQDGPLQGIKGMQSTIGDYNLDDAEPTKQKVQH